MIHRQSGRLLGQLRQLLVSRNVGQVPDGQLLQRYCRDQDEAAFAELVQRHGPRILCVGRRVLQDGHAAEDVFQATFLVLARRAAAVRQPDAVGCWLHGVALRLALKARDRARAERRHEMQIFRSPSGDPEEEISLREARLVLDQALQSLPEKHRFPLMLCYLEGKTRDEAAHQLGCHPETLKKRLERGRELLRVRLARSRVSLSSALVATLLAETSLSAAVPARLAASAVPSTAGEFAALSPTALALAQHGLAFRFLPRIPKLLAVLCLTVALVGVSALWSRGQAGAALADNPAGYDWQQPDPTAQLPFDKEEPIYFVAEQSSPKEWHQLDAFWNEGTETAIDPKTGKEVTRKVVRIKVPLGLSQPPVPAENPLTVARWALGRELFFDPVLSSDGTIACATCHDPRSGFTTPTAVSKGIQGRLGTLNAPTILNVAYRSTLFWDGRTSTLEELSQEPIQNRVEMHHGEGHAWNQAVERVRAKGTYTPRFLLAFGTEPTRDTIAKALASYQRTVLSGNALHDRAVALARQQGGPAGDNPQSVPQMRDYEVVIEDALARRDSSSLVPLLGASILQVGLNQRELRFYATSIANGRKLFFGKGRCHECHAGERFTDNSFHNQGIGLEEGKPIPPGRLGALPVGRKAVEMTGAFATPTLRGLVHTGPYMHDGSLSTLDAVVQFYVRGGQANEFLDIRRRDLETERDVLRALELYPPEKRPRNVFFGKDRKAVIPLRLALSAFDQEDLLHFLRALQGDPVDPRVADPKIGR
jgi:cytochrome c peroxidase